jgi:DNA-binding GntR family transcriptional regulator
MNIRRTQFRATGPDWATALETRLADATTRYATISEAVTATLREAIAEGLLPENEFLRQDDLAAGLKISRTPIRQVLQRLEAEGLLKILPNRGAIILPLRAEDVQEVYEMRLALEPLALRLSIAALTKADLDASARLLDRAEGPCTVREWALLNRDFHLAVYARCERPRLLRAIEQLYASLSRQIRVESDVLQRRAQSETEHRRILEACRRGNALVAVAELQAHILAPSSDLVAALQNGERHPVG